MMQDFTRAELLRRTPAVYLAEGWSDASGQTRPELRGTDATTAAAQLVAAEVPPQELGFTIAAINLLLPEQEGTDPQDNLLSAIDEALETVARAIQQSNNEGLVEWLSACAALVHSEREIEAFATHLKAVNRQYAVLVSMLPDTPSSSPSH